MKKTFFITLAFVAIAMIASCQKTQIEEPSMTGVTQFTATIQQTKTAIASDGKITWTAGDEITVTDAAEPANSAVYVAQSSGASTTFSLKSGETAVTTAPYTASYGDIYNQTYSETGANCPLTAPETTTTNFTFSCPYAVLKITATSELEVTVNTVEIANGTEVLSTLNCDSGVSLFSEAKVFYVAVKSGTYAELRITFNAIDYTATKARTSEISLAEGDLLPLTLNFTEGDWAPACVAAGTMITMKNGGRKAVENIVVGEEIRTVDHESGEVSSARVCFVWETKNVMKAFTLTFEGGTEVTVVEEHGFFDLDEEKYVFITAYNAKDYFGHKFYDADKDCGLELKSCKLVNKGVDAYAIVTSGHLNHLSNGILSVCNGEEKVLCNIFEFDGLKYDEAKMAADIERYGLAPLEKILEYKGFDESYYYDYNLMYLNVAIGKGMTSWERIQAYSDYYEAYMNN